MGLLQNLALVGSGTGDDQLEGANRFWRLADVIQAGFECFDGLRLRPGGGVRVGHGFKDEVNAGVKRGFFSGGTQNRITIKRCGMLAHSCFPSLLIMILIVILIGVWRLTSPPR